MRSTGQRWRACGSRVFGAWFVAPDFADRCAGGGRFVGPAWFADPRHDPRSRSAARRLGGLAAVGPQLARLDAVLEERIEERQQVSALVLVAGRRRTASGAPLASTARWKRLRAGHGASARPSRPLFRIHQRGIKITRDQSSLSASTSCFCNTRAHARTTRCAATPPPGADTSHRSAARAHGRAPATTACRCRARTGSLPNTDAAITRPARIAKTTLRIPQHRRQPLPQPIRHPPRQRLRASHTTRTRTTRSSFHSHRFATQHVPAQSETTPDPGQGRSGRPGPVGSAPN